MTLPTYNPDKKYEMMAALLPSEGQNMPDPESIIEDLRQILILCYEYTINRDQPFEAPAGDLADAIVAYLFNAWADKTHDFETELRQWYLSRGLLRAEDQPDSPSGQASPAEPVVEADS
ncbi:conserved hypothetical protein [Microbacterium sp. 8M]|uniref:hypothetical protein n=1 Tax=Microbacterium sp. 8M TaxID=2653153 RepID=UPI0012F31885|nr:hypothetical protein [Microbacterium sp. 8M]VXC29645.1 conserved hypothetical protein [Microbacterium sp. 8M]